MKVLDRMIARQVATAIGITWLLVVGFDVVSAFAGEFDEFGEGQYGLLAATANVAWTIPRRMYELFPTAAVIGCLMGLGGLAAGSELTAIRAAGWSRRRILGAAAAVVGLLTLLMVVNGETLGPAGDRRSQQVSVAAKSDNVAIARWSGVWAREANTLLNARQGRMVGEGARARVELDDVRLFEFSKNGRLASVATAAHARHDGRQWVLEKVRRTRFLAARAEITELASEVWDSELDPDVLSLSVSRPRYLTTRELADAIEYSHRNGLDAGEFERNYYARFFYPLNAILLCLAVMPLAFGPLRSGGFAQRLFIGILLALGYFVGVRLFQNLAQIYSLPIALINLVLPTAVALGSYFYFKRSAVGA